MGYPLRQNAFDQNLAAIRKRRRAGPQGVQGLGGIQPKVPLPPGLDSGGGAAPQPGFTGGPANVGFQQVGAPQAPQPGFTGGPAQVGYQPRFAGDVGQYRSPQNTPGYADPYGGAGGLQAAGQSNQNEIFGELLRRENTGQSLGGWGQDALANMRATNPAGVGQAQQWLDQGGYAGRQQGGGLAQPGGPQGVAPPPGSTFTPPTATGGVNYDEMVRRYGQAEADRIMGATAGGTNIPPPQFGAGGPSGVSAPPGSTNQPIGGGPYGGLPQEPGVTQTPGGTLIGGGGARPSDNMIPSYAPGYNPATGPQNASGGTPGGQPMTDYGAYQDYANRTPQGLPTQGPDSYALWQAKQQPNAPSPAYNGPQGPVSTPTPQTPAQTPAGPNRYSVTWGATGKPDQATPAGNALMDWAKGLMGDQWKPRSTQELEGEAAARRQSRPQAPTTGVFGAPGIGGGMQAPQPGFTGGPATAGVAPATPGVAQPSIGGFPANWGDAFSETRQPPEKLAIQAAGAGAAAAGNFFNNWGTPNAPQDQSYNVSPPGPALQTDMGNFNEFIAGRGYTPEGRSGWQPPGGGLPQIGLPVTATGAAWNPTASMQDPYGQLGAGYPPGPSGTPPGYRGGVAGTELPGGLPGYAASGPTDAGGLPDLAGAMGGGGYTQEWNGSQWVQRAMTPQELQAQGNQPPTPGQAPGPGYSWNGQAWAPGGMGQVDPNAWNTGGGGTATPGGGLFNGPQPGLPYTNDWTIPGGGGGGGGGMPPGMPNYPPGLPPTGELPPYNPPPVGGQPPAPPPMPPAPQEVDIPEMPGLPEAWKPTTPGGDFLDYLKNNPAFGDLGTPLNYMPGVTAPGEVGAAPSPNEYTNQLGGLGGLQGIQDASIKAVLEGLQGKGGMTDEQRALMLSQSSDEMDRYAAGASRKLGGTLSARGMARGGAAIGGQTGIQQTALAGKAEGIRQANLESMRQAQTMKQQAMSQAPQMYQQQQQQNVQNSQAQLDEWYKRQNTALQSAQQTFGQRLSGAELGLAQRAQDIQTLQADLQRQVAAGQLSRDRAQMILDYGQLKFGSQQTYLDYAARRNALAQQLQAQLSGQYSSFGENIMAGWMAQQGV